MQLWQEDTQQEISFEKRIKISEPSASKCEDPVCHAPEALINSLKGMMSSCGNKPSWAKPTLAMTAAAAATTTPAPAPPISLASGQKLM